MGLDYILVAVYFLLALLGACLMRGVINQFLRPSANIFFLILYYFIFTYFFIIPSWIGDENNILIFLPFIVLILLCYKGSGFSKFILGTIFYTMNVSLNMMVDTMVNFQNIAVLRRWEDVVRTSIKVVFWALLFLYMKRSTGKNEKKAFQGRIELSTRLWGIIGGLILAPLFVIFVFSLLYPISILAKWEINKIYDGIMTMAYLILPWITLFSLMILNAVVILGKHEKLEKQYQLTQLREVYYDGLKREQQQVRMLRHDMNNHFTVVQNMLKKGNVETASQYLEGLEEFAGLKGHSHFCENETADIVLCSKAEKMETENITYEVQAVIPKEMPITEMELCAMLGNALDNAIEAVKNIEDKEDKKITLRSRADKGMFMLQVTNKYEKQIETKDEKILTSKTDKKLHGFGLASITEIVERYNGTMQIITDNGIFELTICIPII